MPVPRALLHTDTLSGVMRGLPRMLSKAREYLTEHRVFGFSIIARVEILRGSKVKKAAVQLKAAVPG